MVERIATIIPIATRNNPFTISEMMPKRMPNIPKAVRTIKPHTASPMFCATCLKFAVAVISTLFLIFFVFNADSRAEGVEFQTILSASVSYTHLVLNSVANVKKALRYLDGYGRIGCFLDRDDAGRRTLEALKERYGGRVADRSALYDGCKDLNEHLQRTTKKQNINHLKIK